MRRVTWAALLALTACAPAPAPETGTIYRTTQGGAPVASTLYIYTPDRAQLITTVSNTAAGGVEGGYRWQLSPNGDNIQLQFSGRNDRLRIPPRGVVQLEVDGVPVFYGIVPDPPPLTDTAPERRDIQALGGREALRVTLMDGKLYTNQGVYDIVRDLLSRLQPPSVNYAPPYVGDGSLTDPGPTLSTFYAPTMPLSEVLDTLAKSAGVTWGVNARSQVFFGTPAPAPLSIGYEGQGWRSLPIQGREAVTRAAVRVISGPALPEGGKASWGYGFGVPATVTATAQAVSHDVYAASKAFDAPQGISLLESRPAVGAAASSDFSVEATRDDDPATGVDVTLTPTDRVLVAEASVERTVGVEFDYTWQDDGSADGAYRWRLYLNGSEATADGPLRPSGTSATVRVLLPPGSEAGATWDAQLSIGADIPETPTPPNPLRVTRIRFLVVNEAVAQDVAASYLQPPYSTPAELTLKTLEPPTPDVTVTGAPGGDVSGPTTLWEYEHDNENVRTTRIRIGATGADPTVRALKFALGQP